MLRTLLTFASRTQRVDVVDGGCGVLTNGVVTVTPTTKLLNELRPTSYISDLTRDDKPGPDGE